MSEIILAPNKGHWAVHADRTESELRADLAATGYRLISIKSYLDGNRRLFTACSVENIGVISGWTPRITTADLTAQLAAERGRLISLDAFVENGKTYCAAVWVRDEGTVQWNWSVGESEQTLLARVAREDGQLTCVRVFQLPAGSFLCAAIWVKADGRPWYWSASVEFDDLYDRLKNGPLNSQEIVSLDSFTIGGKTRFAFVTWRGAASDGWYYRTPVPGPELSKHVRELCCYPFDVCRTYPSGFAIVQYAYPPIAHPNATTLVKLGGAGVITDITPEVIEVISNTVSATHSMGNTVTFSRAVRFFSSPGGWSWFDDRTWNPGIPTSLACIPSTGVAPGNEFVCNENWSSGAPMEFAMTQVEASDGNFQQQEFAPIPLVAHGSPVPAPLLDIAPPAFVGLQAPLEILRMTDGHRLLELKGQVVNFSGREMHIVGIHIDLLNPGGKSVYHADLPLVFKLDFDETGKAAPADYDKANPNHLVSPLPRFRHLIEVPNNYAGGSLEIVLHIQTTNLFTDADPESVIGTKECFHNRRVIPVAEGFVLQISSPVKGRYQWSNGPGAKDWHVHFYPAARYAYDIGKVDDHNRKFDDGKGSGNADYFSWNQEIYSASKGTVVFVRETEEDHLPDWPGRLPERSGMANMVVIRDGNVRYLYAHLKKNSATVAVGDAVTAGQVIGRIGNTGMSSGPHLHLAVFDHDPIGTASATGVLRPLAISVPATNTMAGMPMMVPVDGAVLVTP